MPFKQVTEQDLKGKGVIGQPAVPGLSVTEMQKSVEQVVREAAIPAHNQLCEQLEAEAAAADIGAAVPGQGGYTARNAQKAAKRAGGHAGLGQGKAGPEGR